MKNTFQNIDLLYIYNIPSYNEINEQINNNGTT